MAREQFLFIVALLGITGLLVGFMAVMYRRAMELEGVDARLVRLMSGWRSFSVESFGGLNRWAAYLHRLTGVGVLLFLLLHLVDVSLVVWSEELYDSVHYLYGTAAMRVMECGLLFALLFHAFNGIRLILIDIADVGVIGAQRMLYVVGVTSTVLSVAGSVVILLPIVS